MTPLRRTLTTALLAAFTAFTALTALGARHPLDLPGIIADADSAYSADNFALSADLYSTAIAGGAVNPATYTNLGNCMWRLGRPGQAILNYERALRLDPTYADARANLAFANTRITDRTGQRGTFIANAFDTTATALRADTWAWAAMALFAAACALGALYLFGTGIAARKAGFFGAIACALLCCTAIAVARRAAAIATDTTAAIVTAPSTTLSTTPRTPRSRGEEAMLLHEGTRLRILDSVKSIADSVPSLWLDVEIDDNHRAWVNAADTERVR